MSRGTGDTETKHQYPRAIRKLIMILENGHLAGQADRNTSFYKCLRSNA